jgi:hypothetical protein
MKAIVVTGFVDETHGRLDHVRIAEVVEGVLRECGQVRFDVVRELRERGIVCGWAGRRNTEVSRRA